MSEAPPVHVPIPKPEPVPDPVSEPEGSKAPAAPVPSVSPVPPAAPVSGFSLKDALKAEVPSQQKEVEVLEDQPDEPNEAVGQKLEAACRALEKQLAEMKRSRLALAFAHTSVERNCIRLAVPNENLKKEVEHYMLDLKKQLVVLSGIRCPIEFDIRVEADTSAAKPVSPEDRLKFLAAQNEHLAAFKKALDLEF